MYFPSKRDKWLTAVLWAVPLTGFIAPLLKGQFEAAFIMLLLGLFLLWFWFKTGYRIEKDLIRIKYGPIRQTIKINEIELILKSKAPLTAPALSMDRIQIRCGKYDVTAISPERREEFIQELIEINPEISVDTRLMSQTSERK